MPSSIGNEKARREHWIARARSVHGDRYDYSAVVYVNSGEKLVVICRQHGPFPVIPDNHLKAGCPKCGRVRIREHRMVERAEHFIARARAKHGETCDYSQVVYRNAKTKVIIVCPVHGPVSMTPDDHLTGKHGCVDCGNEQRTQQHAVTLPQRREHFINQATAFHGSRWDYSLVDYVNGRTPVVIVCPVHGRFEQTPDAHLVTGCVGCRRDRSRHKSDHNPPRQLTVVNTRRRSMDRPKPRKPKPLQTLKCLKCSKPYATNSRKRPVCQSCLPEWWHLATPKQRTQWIDAGVAPLRFTRRVCRLCKKFDGFIPETTMQRICDDCRPSWWEMATPRERANWASRGSAPMRFTEVTKCRKCGVEFLPTHQAQVACASCRPEWWAKATPPERHRWASKGLVPLRFQSRECRKCAASFTPDHSALVVCESCRPIWWADAAEDERGNWTTMGVTPLRFQSRQCALCNASYDATVGGQQTCSAACSETLSRGSLQKWNRARRASDPAHRLMCNLRGRINHILKAQSTSKKVSTYCVLGMTGKEFMAYLLAHPANSHGRFTAENYGTTWHVDHIMPLASFDLLLEEEQRIAFHFSNCQPLDAADNLAKGSVHEGIRHRSLDRVRKRSDSQVAGEQSNEG